MINKKEKLENQLKIALEQLKELNELYDMDQLKLKEIEKLEKIYAEKFELTKHKFAANGSLDDLTMALIKDNQSTLQDIEHKYRIVDNSLKNQNIKNIFSVHKNINAQVWLIKCNSNEEKDKEELKVLENEINSLNLKNDILILIEEIKKEYLKLYMNQFYIEEINRTIQEKEKIVDRNNKRKKINSSIKKIEVTLSKYDVKSRSK